MKSLIMFYLSDCGYCTKAFRTLDELCSEKQLYFNTPIYAIEESEHPDIADQYDYYAVPSFFDGKKKLFEAHLFMSYNAIRNKVRRVLDYALTV